MGLFDKKICCVCGGKAGLLFRQKVGGREYLCGKCVEKCSQDLTGEDYEGMTPEKVREHMEYMERNEELYQEKYEESAVVNVGLLGKTVFSADLEHGWWIHNGRHDLYGLDRVQNWNFGMDTSPLSEEERKEEEKKNFFDNLVDSVFSPEFGRGDMQPCPRGRKIDKMYIDVRVKHPWTGRVRIYTIDSWSADPDEVRDGYRAAAKIMDFLEKYGDVESEPIE